MKNLDPKIIESVNEFTRPILDLGEVIFKEDSVEITVKKEYDKELTNDGGPTDYQKLFNLLCTTVNNRLQHCKDALLKNITNAKYISQWLVMYNDGGHFSVSTYKAMQEFELWAQKQRIGKYDSTWTEKVPGYILTQAVKELSMHERSVDEEFLFNIILEEFAVRSSESEKEICKGYNPWGDQELEDLNIVP